MNSVGFAEVSGDERIYRDLSISFQLIEFFCLLLFEMFLNINFRP